MTKLIFTLFFSSLLLQIAFADSKRSLSDAIAKVAAKELSECGIGITIGVARGDEILHLQGYGIADLENEVPASGKGVYRIGSITKMFTAAAILLLEEEGKLGLDDPLQKFLPDYPDIAGKVTIRHLLNHTSGIFSFTDIPNRRIDMRLDHSHEEILAKFEDTPLAFEPGEKFKYCNSGYHLLGMVIESVSGQKYHEFLQERIFDPLELTTTTYDRHLKIIPNRVSGYAKWGDSIVNAQYVSMRQPFAAGALASTARDLLKWQRALATHQLLKPESYKKMTSPAALPDGKKSLYGLGCFLGKVDEHRVIGHGGGIPGFVSELAYFPDEELAIVVLTNAGRNTPRSISRAIARFWFSSQETSE